RQAIAIDEHRRPYRNELFEASNPHASETNIEQRWFVGDHCDVGGGHPGGVLSDVPLRWMQSQAARVGLHFSQAVKLRGDEHLQQLHDTYQHFLKGAFRVTHDRYYRPIGYMTRGPRNRNVRQIIDATVFDRWQQPANYRPPNLKSWADSAG